MKRDHAARAILGRNRLISEAVNASSGQQRVRYARQTAYEALGDRAQERLGRARALVVGLGGLGCTLTALLARAGVGVLRLVDEDVVSFTDLHRQMLYDEPDAAAGRPKALAAAARIARINSGVRAEPVVVRFEPGNAEALAAGVDVILDGTDNFSTRFLINDLAVQSGLPWVFAGVVGAEAQTMTIVPGRGPCLRCVFDGPPPAQAEQASLAGGVLGPAVVAIAAIQAMEAMKILTGRLESVSRYLLKLDLWTSSIQRIEVVEACAGVDCPCCKRRQFDFLRTRR
jgi:molybdopterin/thiamine biosynthesis adenylyltransferase